MLEGVGVIFKSNKSKVVINQGNEFVKNKDISALKNIEYLDQQTELMDEKIQNIKQEMSDYANQSCN